jgi:ribosomal protein S18 acetylase RimI-like enzyme
MSVVLRPVAAADEAFLFDLYASTRSPATLPQGWDADARAGFLRMQFDAQRRHYSRHFPGADHAIIELAGAAIGRLILDQTDAAIRVVDIALLPAHRGVGIGTALLTEVQRSAQASDKLVRLTVAADNPARQLYARLGFVVTGATDVDVHMETTPDRPAARYGRLPRT